MVAIWEESDLAEAARFVVDNSCRSVALQFPAGLLHTGHSVVQDIRSRLRKLDCSAKVYLLAETGHKGKAVDVIGAAHANSDAVIQFGDASLVPVAGVLVHHVLPKQGLQIDALMAEINRQLTCISKDVLVVLLDGPFMHIRGALLDAVKGLPVHVTESPYQLTQEEHNSLLNTLCSSPTSQRRKADAKATCHFLWVGETADNKTLEYAMITHGDEKWTLYDPSKCTVEEDIPPYLQRQIMRRRYLIHLATEADIVGILVGTVGIRDWQTQLNAVKELAQAAGKKSYTFFLGKTPTPEKLANFPEVNVWVHVADPSSFAWHSKEFMAPVIAPVEAELAWKPLLLTETKSACSLVVETSSYAMDRDANSDTSSDTPLAGTNAGALTSQGSRAVQSIGTSAKDFLLRNRTYTGMQTPATGAPLKAASLAAPGMAGRAAAYSQEAR